MGEDQGLTPRGFTRLEMIDMKRIITLFLALMALALTLTACGKVEQYDTSATDDTPIVYKTAELSSDRKDVSLK